MFHGCPAVSFTLPSKMAANVDESKMLEIINTKYKKNPGILRLLTNRITWTLQGTSAPKIDCKYSEIKGKNGDIILTNLSKCLANECVCATKWLKRGVNFNHCSIKFEIFLNAIKLKVQEAISKLLFRKLMHFLCGRHISRHFYTRRRHRQNIVLDSVS